MNLRAAISIIHLLLALSLLTSCWTIGDRGYRMEPTGIEKAGLQNYWVKRVDGIELHANRIRGLMGEWWLDPELAISTSSLPVVIENAELQTAERVYPAQIGQLKLIPVFSDHQHLSISWRFTKDTTASEILGESSRIVIHVKIGTEPRTIEIAYKRVK